MKSDISLVIPCFNESENIDELVGRLNSFFGEKQNLSMEIIFVDDCSADDTFLKLSSAKHISYKAKIIRLAVNSGSHVAFRAGLAHAENDIVTQTSADLQHPLELVESLHEQINKGFHLVITHMVNPPRMNIAEKILGNLYHKLMVRYAIPNYPEGGFDVFMIDGKLKKMLNDNMERNSSVLLQMLSYNFPMVTINYTKKTRYRGKSKWTFSKKIKLFIDSFVAFSYAPVRFVTLAGLSFAFAGFLWTMYLVFRTIFVGDLVQGWPMLMAILMISFGVTNISLGIIAEYLWRTLDASRKRPVFIVDKIVEVQKEL